MALSALSERVCDDAVSTRSCRDSVAQDRGPAVNARTRRMMSTAAPGLTDERSSFDASKRE